MDDKRGILAYTKEEVVVLAYFHSFNRLSVSLYFVNLVQGKFVNMDPSRLTFFSRTCKQSFLVVSETNLGDYSPSVMTVFIIFAVPDPLVVSYSEHFIRLARDVNNASKAYSLHIKVLLL